MTWLQTAPLATPAQLHERILARNALGSDASEATLQVLVHQMLVIEPLTEEECQLISLAADA